MTEHGRLTGIDEALPRMLEAVTPIAGTETAPLSEALGRVLAEPLVARVTAPPWNNSAMDGYAMAAADLSTTGETLLAVIGRSAAGHPFPGRVGPGQAVRILTGAPMPEGADTVAAQEDCRIEGHGVIAPPGRPGTHVRRAGEDMRAGDPLLPAGRSLRPYDLGLAAAAGVSRVLVHRRPRVALFSVGAELREPGKTLEAGAIFDANRYTLIGLLEDARCAVTDLGILPDRRDAITAALARAASSHDAVVTSGGMSVGDEDHLKAAMTEAGGTLDQWRLAIKPGKPVGVGRIGGALFLGLPGNPAAVAVTFRMIARPLLRRLSGASAEETADARLHVRADFELTRPPGRREFLTGRLITGADGATMVRPLPRQGSHLLSGFVAADALIELRETATTVTRGDLVSITPLFRE